MNKIRQHLRSVTGMMAMLLTVTGLVSQNNPVVNAFSKSYQLEKSKNYISSIDALKQVYDSASYEMNLRLGWLSYKAGFNSSAINYYQAAINKMPLSEEAKMGYNYPAYAMGYTDVVIDQYKRILELDPNNTQVCYNIGQIYYYKGDYATALQYFKKITDLYPFDYDGLLMNAWCNYRLGKKAEAEAQFDKVLVYAPNDQSAKEGLSMLGITANKEEVLAKAFSKSYACALKYDYTGAIKVLKDVYDKNSYEINLRLGYLDYLAGFHKESMIYYKQAIELNPKALEPRFGYVYPAAALGNTDELIAQYASILEIDPKNSIANYRLGYISYQKKDFATAYACFEKLVSLYPFSYDGLVMFAKTNFQSGKKEEAKTLFNRVLLLSPADKDATEALAQMK